MSQHAGKGSPWWTWVVAAACIAVAIWLSIIGKPGNANLAAAHRRCDAATVRPPSTRPCWRIQSRCSMCHAAEPVWDGIAIAPKGVRLDTPEEIARHAEAIRIQSVLTHAMPPNNITEMTLDERRAVATWLAAQDTCHPLDHVHPAPTATSQEDQHARTHPGNRADDRRPPP